MRRIRSKGRSRAVTEQVTSRQVSLGMTQDMVREAWSRPQQVNTTVVSGQRMEQWVDGLQTYVYFTNGIVSGIQTSH